MVEGARVRLSGGEEVPTLGGGFEFRGVPAGPILLEAWAEGYVPAAAEGQVRPGQELFIVLVLRPQSPPEAGPSPEPQPPPEEGQPPQPPPDPGKPPSEPEPARLKVTARLAYTPSLLIQEAVVRVDGKVYAMHGGLLVLPGVEPGVPHRVQAELPPHLGRSAEVQVKLAPGEERLVELWLAPVYPADELELFVRLVTAEAEGEPFEGQVAVAASVLNRVLDPEFPNTLREVILQKDTYGGTVIYQYEPAIPDPFTGLSRLDVVVPTESCYRAVAYALLGWDPSLGAEWFYNPDKSDSSWFDSQSWLVPTVKIGAHKFYARAGSGAASVAWLLLPEGARVRVGKR